MIDLSEWKAICRQYAKRMNATLLFVNESDYSIGLEFRDGSFAHLYPDEIKESLTK